MTRYMRWLEDERGLRFDGYDALWRWSAEDLEAFWASIWEFFDVQRRYDEVLADRDDAGRRVVPRRRAVLRRAHLPRPRRRPRWRSATPPSCASSGSGRGTSCARRPRASPPALRALGVERGDRVVAYMPNIPETIAAFFAVASLGAVWSSCSPDFGARSVIDRFAQIEPKVLLAVDGYRYGGKDFDRARADREGAGRDAVARAHGDARLPRRAAATGTRRSRRDRRAAELRPRAVRPPAVGPLLLGHHRPAEGDRARPGRDPARAPQEARPAPRRPGGRPPLLVHHDRLDDVELPGRRAAHRRVDRALRRQPGDAGHGRPVGPRRADRRDHVRHERRLHRRLHEGGRRAGATAATSSRCATSARPARRCARGLRAGSTSTSARTPGCSRPAAAPTCAPRSSAASRCCPSTAASCRPARWARRSRPGTRTGAGRRRGRRARHHPADAVDADLLLGRPGRRALRESYFEMYPGVWRHGDWIEITERGTAIIYGRSDSTINRGGMRMGTTEIYRAVLALDEVVDALVVDVDGRTTRGCRCSSCCARAPSSTTTSSRRSPSACARTARRATCPTRSPGRRGPAHAVGQGARGPGQADPHGRRTREGRQPRLAGQPEALDWFVELGEYKRTDGPPRPAMSSPGPKAYIDDLTTADLADRTSTGSDRAGKQHLSDATGVTSRHYCGLRVAHGDLRARPWLEPRARRRHLTPT